MIILKLIKATSLNLVVIVGFVEVCISFGHINEGGNLKEKLKSSWGHVIEYKLNIILFASLGALLLLLPRWYLPYVKTFPVNKLATIVLVSFGTVTTAQSQLPPLDFKLQKLLKC